MHPTSRDGFDRFADNYDEQLEQSISVSGEDKNYFAQGRILWTAKHVGSRQIVMDYGCGTGSATPFLFSEMGVERVVGVDVSSESIRIARREHGMVQATFLGVDEYRPSNEMDGVFTNGVFHHIPPIKRIGALSYIYDALKPGGWFAFWENNWLSPATRYVMSRCPFDADASPLTPRSAKALVAAHGGFTVMRTDFMFVFPRVLRWLRPLESRLIRFPLGAQYLLLCKRS